MISDIKESIDIFHTTLAKYHVTGLREFAPPSEVKVYKILPDGKQLIRIEEPTYYNQILDKRHKKNN